MTTNSFGVCSKDNAPVDETIVFSSITIPGKDVGTEPVLITIFLALYLIFFPAASVTTTVFSEETVPVPFKWVILFF